MTERTFKRNEREYKRLAAVAKMLEFDSKNDAQYVVEDVYLDLGTEWMWTTICRRGYRECQILCPRDWKRIVSATTMDELLQIEKDIRQDEYFND